MGFRPKTGINQSYRITIRGRAVELGDTYSYQPGGAGAARPPVQGWSACLFSEKAHLASPLRGKADFMTKYQGQD